MKAFIHNDLYSKRLTRCFAGLFGLFIALTLSAQVLVEFEQGERVDKRIDRYLVIFVV